MVVGIGLALNSKFNINSYTGIEINKEAADFTSINNKNQRSYMEIF